MAVLGIQLQSINYDPYCDSWWSSRIIDGVMMTVIAPITDGLPLGFDLPDKVKYGVQHLLPLCES